MLERAEQMHRRFFQPVPAASPSWQPPVDVLESDQGLTIVVALPGVEPADIKAAFDRDQLVVTGVRRLPAGQGFVFTMLDTASNAATTLSTILFFIMIVLGYFVIRLMHREAE